MGLFSRDNRINSSKAEGYFREMLNKAGFSFAKPDPYLAWNVFKDFSKVKFECSDDALLFQCGVYNSDNEKSFQWGFVRQFSFNKRGDYDHMEQMDFSVYFNPDAELEKVETNLWTYDCTSWEDFFQNVEQMNEFIVPHSLKPIKAEMFQSEV